MSEEDTVQAACDAALEIAMVYTQEELLVGLKSERSKTLILKKLQEEFNADKDSRKKNVMEFPKLPRLREQFVEKQWHQQYSKNNRVGKKADAYYFQDFFFKWEFTYWELINKSDFFVRV